MRLFSISSICHDVLVLKNYLSEASFIVVRQLKIVSHISAFVIAATRNIQYAVKKRVCLIVFVKDIFDMFLKKYYIVFSLYLV